MNLQMDTHLTDAHLAAARGELVAQTTGQLAYLFQVGVAKDLKVWPVKDVGHGVAVQRAERVDEGVEGHAVANEHDEKKGDKDHDVRLGSVSRMGCIEQTQELHAVRPTRRHFHRAKTGHRRCFR
jgi:hypothetical protein